MKFKLPRKLRKRFHLLRKKYHPPRDVFEFMCMVSDYTDKHFGAQIVAIVVGVAILLSLGGFCAVAVYLAIFGDVALMCSLCN